MKCVCYIENTIQQKISHSITTPNDDDESFIFAGPNDGLCALRRTANFYPFCNVEEEQPLCFQTNVVCARFGNRKTIFEMKQFVVMEGDNIVSNPSSPSLALRIPP
jgi:hypothetical protein